MPGMETVGAYIRARSKFALVAHPLLVYRGILPQRGKKEQETALFFEKSMEMQCVLAEIG